ncbi:MAG: TIGR03435 family protein [Terracidiphilus sp.]
MVSGKAPWLDSEQYDVIAKSEGDATISSEQLKPMLKQLLQQRFHLKLHHETRLLQGYALVVAKGGPRLNPAKDDPPHGYVAQGSLRGWNMPLQSLAGMLASPLGRPVVDDTGLKGDFDFKLDYAPDQATDSSLPSIFTAIQEAIGLKLRSQKVPVDALVVDQVDRVPTEN